MSMPGTAGHAILLPIRGVVFLSAHPAELQRVQQAIASAGRVELPLQGQQPFLRPLQRGIDRAALTDELVKLEGESVVTIWQRGLVAQE